MTLIVKQASLLSGLKPLLKWVNSMTILEFARSQGITKNKAKYYVNMLPFDMIYKDDKGRIHITQDGVERLLQSGFESGFKSSFKPPKKTTAETTLIELLQKQVAELQKDKEFLQRQLETANNRADFLTIQTLPFYKRKKALKEYNQRLIEKSNH